MQIRYAAAFKRAYRKLSSTAQEHVDRALRLLVQDPFDRRLRNHKLHGSQEGIRSISASYDLRILYIEEGNHSIVLLITVGTHEEVY